VVLFDVKGVTFDGVSIPGPLKTPAVRQEEASDVKVVNSPTLAVGQ
jgi:hypothetical protein